MLLTITTTHRPATDLGYLLHKNPARAQSKTLAFGRALVFYPEATEERCTAALLVEVDPIGLVRGRGATLDQYVNDRPYAASSLLSVALARVFGTAMKGRSKDRPEVVGVPAADHVPLRHVEASGLSRTSRRGAVVLPRPTGGPCGLRREAHGLPGGRRGLSRRGRGPGAVRRGERDRKRPGHRPDPDTNRSRVLSRRRSRTGAPRSSPGGGRGRGVVGPLRNHLGGARL